MGSSNVPFGQSGLDVLPDHRLLVVTGVGAVTVDLAEGVVESLATPDSVTDARVLSSGDIAVVRRHGVAHIGAAESRFSEDHSLVELRLQRTVATKSSCSLMGYMIPAAGTLRRRPYSLR